MKLAKLNSRLLSILITLTFFATVHADEVRHLETASFDKMGKTTNLRDCLSFVGEHLEARFSIETVYSKSNSPDFVKQNIDVQKLKAGDIHEVLDSLIEAAEIDCAVKKDATTPNRYHVVNARVDKLDSYVLDETIEELTYCGTTAGLIFKLHELYPQIRTKFWSSNIFDHMDYSTHVNVKASSITVRELLTYALSSIEYNSVEWIAYTNLDTNLTFIQFLSRLPVDNPPATWCPCTPTPGTPPSYPSWHSQ